MIATTLRISDTDFRVRWDKAVDLSIPLQFDGPQPSHFDAAAAGAAPMRAGDFVGDTRLGGSCNAQVVTLNAHCNGTHTECIGHVCDERVAIRDLAPDAPQLALVLSVTPQLQADGDLCIAADDVAALLGSHPDLPYTALVLRTLPNAAEKLHRVYADSTQVPYLSAATADLIVTHGIQHLLVDVPSIDRLHDGGSLTAHRIVWGLEAGASSAAAAARPSATVTEMIFVPDSVADGQYLLDLQVAPFVSDAAPSRPLIYPLETP